MGFKDSLKQLIAQAHSKAQGGLTYAELGELLTDFYQAAMQVMAPVAIPGLEKKDEVLAAVSDLFDRVAPMIPLPTWLFFLRWPRVQARIKKIVLALVSGAVDVTYKRFREVIND